MSVLLHSTLVIAAACVEDSGIFTCLLENIVGACKSSSNLNVMEASEQQYIMQEFVTYIKKKIW